MAGHAGQAVKLLGAVFGAAAIANKTYVGLALSLLDGGMSYEQLATAAMGAIGRTTHDDVANLLWTNLFGAAPTKEQISPVVALMDGGLSPGALTVLVADSSFIAEKINLVGLSQTGVEFG
jgi:serralysin